MAAAGSSAALADHIDFQRMALVTSPGFTRRGVVERIRLSMGTRLVAVLDDVKPNPDVRDVDAQAVRLRSLGIDGIVALGGGSSIDTAKALARVLPQPGNVTLTDHFRSAEVFASGINALPVGAIPTTAGTGAEVTPFGTIWDFEFGKKYSVAGDDLYPSVAILDPELTLELPVEVTVSSGLDAISHALESVWNHNASPITLALAAKSLQLSLHALPELGRKPGDIGARSLMMQASLLAGMAISQTRTALAHSISYPLTTEFGLPHGIACSFTLPELLRFNQVSDDGRMTHLARSLGHAGTDALADALDELLLVVDLPEVFRKHVSKKSQVLGLSNRMIAPGRAENNLREVSGSQLLALLEGSLERIGLQA
ncbi:phosphonoacetaldehyde reductase [Stenotrophomonas mori]|uniref:Phosphonoacetaldehyde reductase n=1 Tax=Stenotrophomonas mori TaxID=2871096 RepID=A0ABT0SHX9_9GAMM|nr:phosphonoacetaldehyde reductase [Stenotrophomonas mori]